MTRRRWLNLFIVTLFLLAYLSPPDSGYAAVITVDTTADDDVVNGNCTLREAMIAARDNTSRDNCPVGGTSDTIAFNINTSTDPGCSGSTCTIQPLTALPVLIGAGDIRIDGYSQPGSSEAIGDFPANIRIVIDGSLSSNYYGIEISSPGNIVSGIAIHGFDFGILLNGTSAANNHIRGCYIGTDSSGTIAYGNAAGGIWLSEAGDGNIIGGTTSAERNIISGNGDTNPGAGHGIFISNISGSTTISGNYIGLTPDGFFALGNEGSGVAVVGDQMSVAIGGTAPGERNLISGNSIGIHFTYSLGSSPHDNTVEGNWIGLNILGDAAVPNNSDGVVLHNGAYDNTIGPGNVISGNVYNGVSIRTAGTNGNRVEGNFIGTDPSGMTAIPNGYYGVSVESSAQANLIGGDEISERNVIAGNTYVGVRIKDTNTDDNIVSGNYIGITADGTVPLFNGTDGVEISNNAAYTQVGGTSTLQRNVIASTGYAVRIDSSAHNNTVSANLIGTDASGTTGMGGGSGVYIASGAHANTIGGVSTIERNVISGNGGVGVVITGSGTDSNQVLGNYIGVDIGGVNPLPNETLYGVNMTNSAQYNQIGPRNVIANHDNTGIRCTGTDTDYNVFTQNSIYANTITNIGLGTGSNQDIGPPTISSVNFFSSSVSGTTSPICSVCTVELFTSPTAGPSAGKTYLGSTTTDIVGNWTISPPVLYGPYLTATLTSLSMGTSGFSSAFLNDFTVTWLPLIMR